jgi:hypothetical protein
LPVARDENRLSANVRGEEVVRILNLIFEANKYPSAFENLLHFMLEDALIPEDFSSDAENTILRPIVDKGAEVEHHKVRIR